MTPLNFTHGIEMEVQIVEQKGSLLVGPAMKNIWKRMLQGVNKQLNNLSKQKLPSIVSKKYQGARLVEVQKGEKRLNVVQIDYKLPSGEKLKVDSFGPDPNIGTVHWILELVTPPCETLEEMAFWCSKLYEVALDNLPRGYSIISLGLNPLSADIYAGLTFGDHHHIGGFAKIHEKKAAYNLLRNFVPHLISLTTNSPFIGANPTGGSVRISRTDGRIRILPGKNTKSLRLTHNTSQIGPLDIDHYIPYLTHFRVEKFNEVVGRDHPDNRFVDIFPFTRFNTIELRFFDCQLSVRYRLAIVALLQALCLKAVKLTRQGIKIFNISSSTILKNREKAVEFGLLGRFFTEENLDERYSFYNDNPFTGKRSSRMFEAVQSLLVWIWPEILELELVDAIKPVWIACYGTSSLFPPCNPADYLLYLYNLYGQNFEKLISSLQDMTKQFCADSQSDPLLSFGDPFSGDLLEQLNRVLTVKEEPPLFDATLTIRKTAKFMPGDLIPLKLIIKNISGENLGYTINCKLKNESSTIITDMLTIDPSHKNVVLTEFPDINVPHGMIKGNSSCIVEAHIQPSVGKDVTVRSHEFSVIGSAAVSIEMEEPSIIKEKASVKVKFINETPMLTDSYIIEAELLLIETGKIIEIYRGQATIKRSKTFNMKVPLLPDDVQTGRFIFRVFHEKELICKHQSSNILISKARKKILSSSLVADSVIAQGKVKAKVNVSRLASKPTPKTQIDRPKQRIKPEVKPQPVAKPAPKHRSRSATKPVKPIAKPKLRAKPKSRSHKAKPQIFESPSQDSPEMEVIVELDQSSSPIPVPSVKPKPKRRFRTKITIPPRTEEKKADLATSTPPQASKIDVVSSKPKPKSKPKLKPKPKPKSKPSIVSDIRLDRAETRILAQKEVIEGKLLPVPIPKLKRLKYDIAVQRKTLMQVDEPIRIVFDIQRLDRSNVVQQCVLRLFYVTDSGSYELFRRLLPIKVRRRFAYHFKLSNSLPLATVFKIRAILTLGETIAGEYLSSPIRCLPVESGKNILFLGIEPLSSEASIGEALTYFIILESTYLIEPVQIRIVGKLSVEDYLPIEREVYTVFKLPGIYRVPVTIEVPSKFAGKRGTVEINVLSESGFSISHFTSQVSIADKSPIEINLKPVRRPVSTYAYPMSLILNNPSSKPCIVSGKILLLANLVKEKGRPFRVKLKAESSHLLSFDLPFVLRPVGDIHFVCVTATVVQNHVRSYKQQYFEIKEAPFQPLIKATLTAPTNYAAQGENIPLGVDIQVNQPLERVTDYRLEIYELTTFSERILKTFSFKKLKQKSFRLNWKVPTSPIRTSIVYYFSVRLYEGNLLVSPQIFQFKGWQIEAN
ncbi:MAG: hypothetical protein ACFFDI_08810 [Promethearchaeota archaeon]